MTRSNPLDVVILGLSLRSSWGNGHATTYRALLRAMLRAGHRVRFLERDVPWYADNDDMPGDLAGSTALYGSIEELCDVHADEVAAADLVIVGSYVPEGIAVGDWVQGVARGVTAFYDIDTPVTLARLERDDCEYLHASLIPGYDLYLSFTGGPLLETLRQRYGAHALPFYCAVDPERYHPDPDAEQAFDLGYMGTYSADRQPGLERLLMAPARAFGEGRFVVAGPQYPAEIDWPDNVERREHVAPAAHAHFYNAQRFTLNLTRADMVAAGWSPSVRLFEAAACGTPIISDAWPGLDRILAPGSEILIAREPGDVLDCLRDLPDARRRAIGAAARRRVLAEHTADHRVETLEQYVERSATQRTAIPAWRAS
ncbi:MAG: glycosyltransferase [Xanthomonadales bacterium]|nr:glycosyltransferase [Xanthomonadales bacterium]